MCLLAVGALGWLATTAYGAQQRQWTGAGEDNWFANPNNWDPVGTPQDSDTLVFPAGADARNNIFWDPIYDSVIFTGSGTARISGVRLSVLNRIYCDLRSGVAQMDLDVRAFQGVGAEAFYLGVAEGATLSMAGHLATVHLRPDPFFVRKVGLGTLILSATNKGSFQILEGVLIPMSVGAFGGESYTNVVTVSGGTLQLVAPIPNPLWLAGNGAGGTNGALMVPANSSVTLTQFIELLTSASINVAENASLAIDGRIHGAVLTKFGSGDLYLGGVGNNTYSGDTFVKQGALYLSKNQGVTAVPRNLIVEAAPGSSAVARFVRSGMMNASATVTVNANSVLDLNGNNQTLGGLVLNDGADVQTGTGTLSFRAGAVVSVGTLNPPEVGLQRSSSIRGRIALPVLDYLTFDVAPYARGHFPGASELEIPAVIGEAGNIIKLGEGALRLSGANTFNDSPPNFSGDVFVNRGALVAAHANALGGTAGWTWVNSPGSLALAGGISINGETLYLDTDNSPALDSWGDNIWNGPINLSRDSIISVGENHSLEALGAIGGMGSLIKLGAGTLSLGGAAHNTYAGNTFVNQGTLALSKTYGFHAVPASLVVGQPNGGPARAVYLDHDQISGSIIVNDHGLLDLNGFDEFEGSLTLNGGGDVQTGLGSLFVLNGGITVNPGNNTVSTISGKLGFDTGKHTIHVGSGATIRGLHELVVSAAIFEAHPGVSLEKTGAGGVRFMGTNTHTGTNYISAGTLQVDGVQPQSAVYINGGTLLGTGTVGPVRFSSASGEIAPGGSPGILTSGNFAGAPGTGTLSVELNGGALGSQYDQLNVRGTVNLNGLALRPALNFNPAVGNQFTIIDNDGTDAVTGTFTGLPQGGELNTAGGRFRISYTGGSGNDVVLTLLSSAPQLRVTTLPATEVPNYAVEFDGSNDRVQAATNSFSAVANSFTIELWANPTGFRTPTAEVNTGISDINQRFAVFPDHGDAYGPDHVCAGLSVGFNGISVYEHAVNYLPSLLVYPGSISGWTHVALVYENRQPRLYVNGTLVRTGLTSTRPFVHPSANLGGSIHAAGYGPYQGQIDEVRIWNVALSQAQIETSLNSNFSGAEAGLVAYYRCDENAATSIADSAPASPNNSGTLMNGAYFSLSGAPSSGTMYGPRVTLNGQADPAGYSGWAWFEWGTTTNYGNVTVPQVIAAGPGNVSFVRELAELAAGSYHFRAVASNIFNASFGLDQSFTLLYGTPLLRIETSQSGEVRLLWPVAGPVFRLQSSTNLNPASWLSVLSPDTVVGTDRVVTNAANRTSQFYRLINP